MSPLLMAESIDARLLLAGTAGAGAGVGVGSGVAAALVGKTDATLDFRCNLLVGFSCEVDEVEEESMDIERPCLRVAVGMGGGGGGEEGVLDLEPKLKKLWRRRCDRSGAEGVDEVALRVEGGPGTRAAKDMTEKDDPDPAVEPDSVRERG